MNLRDTMYRTQIVMYTLYNRHYYISINYMSLYMHGVREIINLSEWTSEYAYTVKAV